MTAIYPTFPSAPPAHSTVGHFARYYLSLGWRAIPVVHRDKKPAVAGWQNLELDELTVGLYFETGPANVGVVLGDVSGGLVDVDIDDDLALKIAGNVLPRTPAVFGRPSRPGSHRLYTTECRSRQFKDPSSGAMLVEIRSTGMQTVFPPSVHSSGEKIEFEEAGAPSAVSAEALEARVGMLAAIVLLARHWPTGPSDRQQRAMALAGAFLSAGMTTKQATAVVCAAAHLAGDEESRRRGEPVAAAEERIAAGKKVYSWPKVEEFFSAKIAACLRDWLQLVKPVALVASSPGPHTPKLDISEIGRRIDALSSTAASTAVTEVLEDVRRSGLDTLATDELLEQIASKTGRKAAVLRRAMQDRGGREDLAARLEQLVLAEEFAGGRHIVYGEEKQFWTYQDGFWAPQTREQIERRVLTAIERRNFGTGGNKANLISSTVKLLAARAANSSDVLGLRSAPKPIINVRNGELWLLPDGSTELREHRPESHLTYRLDVVYDPKATCPTYDAVVAEIFSNAADPAGMIRHFNELFGYIIQPVRDIPAFFIFLGQGSNGKSKLIETVQALMGPAAVFADRIDCLEGNRFAIGNLAGKLLFLDDDVQIGTRLPDGLLKKLSEQKLMTGERKHGGTFEFQSSVVPVFLCNNPPNVADLSGGLRRRANVIPFRRVFKPEEQNPELFRTILSSELPGVLNRALEGLRELRKRARFEKPTDCVAAEKDWLRQANPLPEFLEVECEADPGSHTRVSELYNAYKLWAARVGVRSIIAQGMMKSNLRMLGYDIADIRGYPEVRGLRLRRPYAVLA